MEGSVFGSTFTILGISLAVGGILLAFTSHFVLSSVSLTALGISALFLAAVSLALGRGQPSIPPEISSMLLDSGLENTAALIEELGLGSKAVYLPSSLAGGKPRALLILSPGARLNLEHSLPNRLIVRYGQRSEEMGALVTTLGSTTLQRTGIGPVRDLQGTLSYVLVGSTELADSVKVAEVGATGIINIEITNPRLEHKEMRVFENIGSPLASVVASAAAEALLSPVEIVSEERRGKRHIVKIKPLRRELRYGEEKEE